ncbi:YHYH protein [Crocinitomicaceae bacterium]|nr:YHYH protein [Crocinitomicaceae bacterium]
MKFFLLSSCLLISLGSIAQVGPEISAWIRNTTNETGYNSLPSNVQVVQYTTTDVYVSSSCIPGYDIGPWAQNPNTPSNQSLVYKITRSPEENLGAINYTSLGAIGIWSNGVAIYNQKDGYYWDDNTTSFTTGVTNSGWNRNALYFEGVSFDDCVGHPDVTGTYHHHVNPPCLYDDTDDTQHSPIIGYAFDGFPIYGAYGYTEVNGTGAIKRMESSYVLNSLATSRLNGPPINSEYPLTSMCEDYEYTQGAGDLDEHNGRFCVTPEYPNGIYAYFVTIDANLDPVYPFVLGNTFYGVVQSGNTGPNGGNNTIPSSTTIYEGESTTGLLESTLKTIECKIMPNPSADYVYIYMSPESQNNVVGNLYNAKGEVVQHLPFMQPTIAYSLDLTELPRGTFFLTLESDGQKTTHKIVKSK